MPAAVEPLFTERTNYFETLPGSYLPRTLFGKRSHAFSESHAGKPDNQRNAVRGENGFGTTTSVNAFLLMNDLSLNRPMHTQRRINGRPRRRNRDDVQEFFVFIARLTAVLAVVGDFDSQQARELVQNTSAHLAQPNCRQELTSRRSTQLQKQRSIAAHSQHTICSQLKMPARQSEFYAVARRLSVFDGDSSRLYQKLVKEMSRSCR